MTINRLDTAGEAALRLRLADVDITALGTRDGSPSILPGGCVVIRLPGEQTPTLDRRTTELLERVAETFRTGKIDRLETAIDQLAAHLRETSGGRGPAEVNALIDRVLSALGNRLQDAGIGARSREVLASDVKSRLQADLAGTRADRLDPSALDSRTERLLRYHVLAAADGQMDRAGAIAHQIVAGLQRRTEGKSPAEVSALLGEVEKALRVFAGLERGEGGRRAERAVARLMDRIGAACRPADPYPDLPPALEADLKAWLEAAARGDDCATGRLAERLVGAVRALAAGKPEAEVREILHQAELLLREFVPACGPERGRALGAIARLMRALESACRPPDPYPALPPALEADLKAWLEAAARGDDCEAGERAEQLREAVRALAAGKAESEVEELLHQLELLLRRLVATHEKRRERALAAIETLLEELAAAAAAPAEAAPPASQQPAPPASGTPPAAPPPEPPVAAPAPAPAPTPMPEPVPEPPIVIGPSPVPVPPPIVILPVPIIIVLPWPAPRPPVVVRPPFFAPPPIVIRPPWFPPPLPPIVVRPPVPGVPERPDDRPPPAVILPWPPIVVRPPVTTWPVPDIAIHGSAQPRFAPEIVEEPAVSVRRLA